MELGLIRDLAYVWIAALIAGHVFARFKQPLLAGYMLAGILIGPHGLKLINDITQIRVVAEFGVAMLLFALAVDLPFKQIVASAKNILLSGVTQMVGTVAIAWLLVAGFGLANSAATGFLFGCVCAISSSVVISKVLAERGESESIHGQILIPLALVQDLSLVVIIPIIPVLQQSGQNALLDLGVSLAKAAVFILLVFLGATKAAPVLIRQTAKTNSRELFILTLIALCMSVALLSETLGLSIALGAFLAGIMISESPYVHQALTDVLPLRDLFSTVFFVSIGMLLDPGFIAQHAFEVAIFVTLLIAVKVAVGTVSALWATKNLRSAILVGVGLAQIGEFSFVLLSIGFASGLITDAMYNLFFAGAVVTLLASPALIAGVPKLLTRWLKNSGERSNIPEHQIADLENHVIVCGFGRIGRNVGNVLKSNEIPFVVLELNSSIVHDLAEQGIAHIYGDAMSPIVLAKANVEKASTLVVTVPDPISATALISFAKSRNPNIKVIARAHRTEDINAFRATGANAVVQPEFEASIEITRLTLQSLERPTPEIQSALDGIKRQRYTLFRPDIAQPRLAKLPGLHEDRFAVWFKVNKTDIAGQTLKKLDVRGQTGAVVTSIRRGGRTIPHPGPNVELSLSDELYVIGEKNELRLFEQKYRLARFCPVTDGTSSEISVSG